MSQIKFGFISASYGTTMHFFALSLENDFLNICREILPNEERTVQRRIGNLQKILDTNDQSLRVPQNR